MRPLAVDGGLLRRLTASRILSVASRAQVAKRGSQAASIWIHDHVRLGPPASGTSSPAGHIPSAVGMFTSRAATEVVSTWRGD